MNQTTRHSISFWERNKKPIFRMSKKKSPTTKNLNKYHCLEVTQKKIVVKAFCSSEVTIHQLKILYVDTE